MSQTADSDFGLRHATRSPFIAYDYENASVGEPVKIIISGAKMGSFDVKNKIDNNSCDAAFFANFKKKQI